MKPNPNISRIKLSKIVILQKVYGNVFKHYLENNSKNSIKLIKQADGYEGTNYVLITNYFVEYYSNVAVRLGFRGTILKFI